jgi:hypothetical protein
MRTKRTAERQTSEDGISVRIDRMLAEIRALTAIIEKSTAAAKR